jgi:cysteine-rich repeat protein
LLLLVLSASPGCSGADETSTSGPGGGGSTSTTSSGGAGGSGASGGAGGTGATGGASSGGGGQGGGPTCGDGAVDAGEACDTAGESDVCDADCTEVACGDGVRNAAAGEQCDDGDTADGDACSAACEPTEMIVDGPYLSAAYIANEIDVAASGEAFFAVWSKHEISVEPSLHYLAFDGAGKKLGAPEALAGQAIGRVGASESRGLAAWYESGSNTFVTRFATGGGALEPMIHTAPYAWYAAKPVALPDGRFCLFSQRGQAGCTTEGTDELGAASTVVSVPPEYFPIESHALFARGDGVIAAYVTKGVGIDPPQMRVRPLDGEGAPAGPEVVLADTTTFSTKALGGVVRGDGSFGVLFNVLDDIVWFPFDAAGEGDPAGVLTLSENTGGAGLAAHSSGRFFVVWREVMTQFVGGTNVDTCALFGQVVSPDLQKVGGVVPVFVPLEQGSCAWVPHLAANEAGDVIVGFRRFMDTGATNEETTFFVKIFPGLLADL